MLETAFSAKEVALITTALTLAADDWGDPSAREALNLCNEIINAWVQQNPDAFDLPWLKPIG